MVKKHYKFTLVVVAGFLLVVIFLLTRPSEAKTKPEADKTSQTKVLMNQFLEQMEALKKYLLSEEKFADAKNKAPISAHLKKLAQLADKAEHDPVLNQENFKISNKVLVNHINETERVFLLGNKNYARWMLHSTLSVCMSCHSQMPTTSRAESFADSKSFTNAVDQAEFLFATRAFDKASELFDRVILKYPEGKYEGQDIEKALQRQVAYYTRIQRDPKAGLKAFAKYDKNKALPLYIKKDIKAWMAQFKTLSETKAINPKTASEDQILRLAESNLPTREPYSAGTDSHSANHMMVSGILYEYLQSHPKSKIVPELLYYLSVYDRSINNHFFYSLANLYLRECIVSYPQNPIAEKCFYELEAETVLSYSGSSGTHIPKDVRDDLKELERLVKTKGKARVSKPKN